jgi:hypothetical protein
MPSPVEAKAFAYFVKEQEISRFHASIISNHHKLVNVAKSGPLPDDLTR